MLPILKAMCTKKGWVMIKRKVVITLILPLLHLGLCMAISLGLIELEGSWAWFMVFLVDFPFSILLLPLAKIIGPFLAFGVMGTAWWYMLSKFIVFLFRRAGGPELG